MSTEVKVATENNLISAELQKEIEQFLTPKKLFIFKTLASGGERSQGDIARISHSTAAALSNQLSMFDKKDFKLLEVRVDGRHRYYSLSKLGRAYAETIRIGSQAAESESPLFQEARILLKEFKQMYTDQWESCFNNAIMTLVYGRGAVLDEAGERLINRYLRCVELLTLEGDEVALDQTLNLLSNEILQNDVEKLMNYFQPFIAVLVALKPERDPFDIYMLVKAAFDGEESKAHKDRINTLGWENDEYGKLREKAGKLKKYLEAYSEQEIYQYFNKLLPDKRELSLYIARCVCGNK